MSSRTVYERAALAARGAAQSDTRCRRAVGGARAPVGSSGTGCAGARHRAVGALVGRARSRALNAHYRGRDYATNVLSFPTPSAARATGLLGDLVICPEVLRREVRRKSALRAHWAHLVVHGVLHLLGYDHEREPDARRMQRREVTVLRRLGFANPYVALPEIAPPKVLTGTRRPPLPPRKVRRT